MRIHHRLGAAAVVAVGLVSAEARAATLDVVLGTLVGASNVNVDGSLYNVEFVDGTCIALFGGCDEPADFTFTTAPSALAAAQALLDQVFIDGVAGLFDSWPDQTRGCFDPDVFSSDAFCNAHTPFSVGAAGNTVEVSTANNINVIDEEDVFPDFAGTGVWDPATDTTDNTSWDVFAVWSVVPEPATSILIGAGLLAIAGRRRSAAPK
jgi:hypothetical protein